MRRLCVGITLIDLDPRHLCDLGQRLEHLLAGQPRVAAEAIAQQVHPVLADARQGPRTDHQLDSR
jgi:hypothetical protein